MQHAPRCVSADTWVMTSEGPRQVRTLVGQRFSAVVDGRAYRVSSNGFFATGSKPVFELSTREGHILRLTADHPVRRLARPSGRTSELAWTCAGALRADDQIVLNNHRSLSGWSGPHTEDEGYLLGLMMGNRRTRIPTSALTALADQVGSGDAHAASQAAPQWDRLPGLHPSSGALGDLARSLGADSEALSITPTMEASSSAFCAGLLRGLFDAASRLEHRLDGRPALVLTLQDALSLRAAQRMLLRLGVVSAATDQLKSMRRHDAQPGTSPDTLLDWSLVADAHLIVDAPSLASFAERVGFDDAQRAARLEHMLALHRRELPPELFIATVAALEHDGVETVYDLTVEDIHAFDANGLLVHNCTMP